MNLFIQTLSDNWEDILTALGEHIYLSLISIVIGCLISIPVGIYITRHEGIARVILLIVSVIQTIPSLALLGFLIPLFGIGTIPAVVALTLYALLPIMRNTYTGIKSVDSALLESAKGMGMTRSQILWMVELPLARQVIMAGIRTATVLTIGVATLATFIGAGGLGDIIMRGISMIDAPTILAGAIPAALLAILFDYGLNVLDRVLTPKGLK